MIDDRLRGNRGARHWTKYYVCGCGVHTRNEQWPCPGCGQSEYSREEVVQRRVSDADWRKPLTWGSNHWETYNPDTNREEVE